MFLIALLSFTATFYYSFAGMKRLVSAALSYGDRQGRQLTRDSHAALRKRINNDLKDTAADQARIVGLLLENIAGAVDGVIVDVNAGRLYLGGGNPEMFRTEKQAPDRPEQFALCHFLPDAPQSVRSPATVRELAAAIPFLFELRKSSPFIESAAIILPDGVQLFHPWRKLPPGYDARKQPWFREAEAAKGKICWAKSGKDILICARAAYSDGRLLAVVAAEIPLERISGQVTAIRSGYLSFLTSADGEVISGSREFESFSGSAAELQEKIRTRQTGVFQLKGEDGPLLAAFAPVPDCGWNLVVCQPEALAMKSIRDMEKMLETERQVAQTIFENRIQGTVPVYILILTVALILILLLGYLLAKQLTRPISCPW